GVSRGVKALQAAPAGEWGVRRHGEPLRIIKSRSRGTSPGGLFLSPIVDRHESNPLAVLTLQGRRENLVVLALDLDHLLEGVAGGPGRSRSSTSVGTNQLPERRQRVAVAGGPGAAPSQNVHFADFLLAFPSQAR